MFFSCYKQLKPQVFRYGLGFQGAQTENRRQHVKAGEVPTTREYGIGFEVCGLVKDKPEQVL